MERTRLRSIQLFTDNIRNLMIKRRAEATALLYSKNTSLVHFSV